MQKLHRQGYLAALAAVVIWSGFILVSRMGGISQLLSYDVIAIRYMTCGLIVLPIWWFKYRFKLFQPKLIVLSIIGGLAYALFVFKGFELTPASQAAVILPGLMPVLIIVLSVLINKQSHPMTKWLGTGVITFGVTILFWQEFTMHGEFSLGHLSMVGAALCWALFSVLLNRWQVSPWQVTTALSVVTCLVYMPIYLLCLPKQISFDLWQDILLQSFYQGVLAATIQVLLYTKAVQLIGAAGMGSMMALVPIFAGLSALYVFDEPLKISLIISIALVSFGVWLANTGRFSNSQKIELDKPTLKTSS
jgi:drug/metabolite transporter (DMT)-like permease